MGESKRRFGLARREDPMLAQRVCTLVLALAFVAFPVGLTPQTAGPDSTEIRTYLATQLPPAQGAPVCLTGGAEPIGRVGSVRLLPDHREGHDGWEVVMEIDKHEASRITTDSVVSARSYPEGSCGASSTNVFLDINVIGSGQPIANHALLKGEVTYSAEIAYMEEPAIDWKGCLIAGVCMALGFVVTLTIFRGKSWKERLLRLPLFLTCALPFYCGAVARLPLALEPVFTKITGHSIWDFAKYQPHSPELSGPWWLTRWAIPIQDTFFIFLLVAIVWAFVNLAVGYQRKTNVIAVVAGVALIVPALYLTGNIL
jgi:hypothetical protein